MARSNMLEFMEKVKSCSNLVQQSGSGSVWGKIRNLVGGRGIVWAVCLALAIPAPTIGVTHKGFLIRMVIRNVSSGRVSVGSPVIPIRNESDNAFIKADPEVGWTRVEPSGLLMNIPIVASRTDNLLEYPTVTRPNFSSEPLGMDIGSATSQPAPSLPSVVSLK